MLMAQIFGLIAFLFIVLSYQAKNKIRFLLFQIFANIFFGLQYVCLYAFSAFVSSIVSLLRTIIFFKFEKDNKTIHFGYLLCFEMLIICLGMLTYDGLMSLIPVFIAGIYAYGTWQKRLEITCCIGILVSILWIFYNWRIGAYVAILGSVFELLSSCIGLIRLLNQNVKSTN